MNVIKKFLLSLLHLVFPYPCDMCEKILSPGDHIRVCRKCFHLFCQLSSQKKLFLHKEVIFSQEYRYCFSYQENSLVQKLLLFAKFYKHPSYIKLLCDILLFSFRDFLLQYDVFVPVPSHKYGIQSRLFCLSYELTKALSSILKRKFCPDVLIVPTQSVEQKKLSRQQRILNVSNKFFVQNNPHIVYIEQSAKVLIVDDVITTGASINAVALLLQNQLNISNIGVFALAKAI